MAVRSRLAPWLGEAALAAGVVAVAVVLAVHHGGAPVRTRVLEALAMVLLCAGALGARRQHPLAVLATISVVALAVPDTAAVMLPTLLAAANVAYRRGLGQTAAAGALAAAGCVGGVAIQEGTVALGQVVSHLVAIGLALAAGMYLAARHAHLASVHDRAAQLEREQALLTDQAVAAERVRIARELHDVVAHGVSLMVVQAQALGALEGTARDAAGTRIAAIGREALTEMHRMLGVLRPQADEDPELAPAPGIHDVPLLVERARGAGLEVALEVSGRPRALPAGVDLSAYRIVQEALTNVVKHARALRAEVRVRYAPAALELTVLDDGAGSGAGAGAPPGHGLLGMRERVALFGGTLESGRRTDAPGYAVRAVLPL